MADLLREIASDCPRCGVGLIGTACDDCGYVEPVEAAGEDALVEELTALLVQHRICPCGCDRCSCPDQPKRASWSQHVTRVLLPIIRAHVQAERKAAAVEALRRMEQAIPYYKGALSPLEVVTARRKALEASRPSTHILGGGA